MPRKKLSEFRAKSLLYGALGQKYNGLELDAQDARWRQAVEKLDGDGRYVAKIDQAEKGRFKKGLVKLDLDRKAVLEAVEKLFAAGYRFALVEPYQTHDRDKERYLAIERAREGLRLSFSKAGGVDVEEQGKDMKTGLYAGGQPPAGIDVPADALTAVVKAFEDNYFSFLEINPLLVKPDGSLGLLDAAGEVDSEAAFFEEGWDEADLRRAAARTPLAEELAVQALADNSQASFSLEVLEPQGSIFLLLSGGGASVVVADEVFNLGFGKQLANYGEYSGNPNQEETQIYTEQVIKLLLASKAPRKALVIAGGVANFTDVRATFKGVIAALEAHQAELKKQPVNVFVRRGGPHEREGLAAMKSCLENLGIAGTVAGPELLLVDIVSQAVKYVKDGGV